MNTTDDGFSVEPTPEDFMQKNAQERLDYILGIQEKRKEYDEALEEKRLEKRPR